MTYTKRWLAGAALAAALLGTLLPGRDARADDPPPAGDAAAAPAGDTAAPAAAKKPKKGGIIVLEAIKVEGRIQKPQAFYILQRTNLNFTSLDLDRSFLTDIEKSVTKDPF
ncbi:MAG TPA: hypothetical protein VG389_05230 [Myxococcota bacterium]|jgi:hypothetical protein|nr:hypothetical protein [Myxococcota bacterium]